MKIPDNKQYVLFGGSFLLANKLQQVADRKVEGLSSKQWFLLRNLTDMPEQPAPTITSLARETDSSRQNVTKMLETLARQGCVRLEDNPHDHRSRRVRMTARGESMLDGMAERAADFFAQLFAGIRAEETATAARVTLKMIENLERMQREMDGADEAEKKEEGRGEPS